MSNTDIEIVVEDPTAPEADSPAVTSVRAADVVVSPSAACTRADPRLGQLAHGRRLGIDRPAGRLFSVLSLGHPRRRQPLWPGRRVPVAQGGFRGLRDAGAASPRDGGVRADAAVLPRHAVPRALCRELPPDRRFHAHGRQDRAVEVVAHRLRVHRRDVRDLRHRLRRHHAKGPARSGARPLTVPMGLI